MKKVIIAVIALACATPAQAMYKCTVNGSVTFSDKPCANDAEKIDIRTAKSEPGTGLPGAVLCRQNIPKFLTFKDPDSVKLKDFVKFGSDTRKVHGVTVAVNLWSASVNAKNSYGGYTGEKAIFCVTDIGDQMVFEIYMSKD